MPSRSQIDAVKTFISQHWEATLRQPDAQQPGEIPLPYPFIVPTAGPEFHLFFYWDTYFACEGLLREGRVELARLQAENMLHLIDTLGYVPNFTIHEHNDRSQPPVASALVRAIYDRTHDRTWLAQAHATLCKEHAFWMALRRSANGLNHYGHHAIPKMVDNFYWVIHHRVRNIPADPTERMIFLAHYMGEAESGWDFSPRFEQRCADFNAVDLNSLLFMHEANAAYFCDELGNGQGDLWRARARRRQSLVQRYCWDEASGFFYDYDVANDRRSPVLSAAAYFTLWSGLADPDQAARLVHNLPLLEQPFGLVACAPGPRPQQQVYQWDHPNVWPPSQFGAIAGLLRYEHTDVARRLAEKYIACVVNGFEASGNLWEKYNGVTGGVDVSDEYAMPAMLGWTAGTFLLACEVLGL
jgi:alpha,alpha-trehalase